MCCFAKSPSSIPANLAAALRCSLHVKLLRVSLLLHIFTGARETVDVKSITKRKCRSKESAKELFVNKPKHSLPGHFIAKEMTK